jgi:hypothetical protein
MFRSRHLPFLVVADLSRDDTGELGCGGVVRAVGQRWAASTKCDGGAFRILTVSLVALLGIEDAMPVAAEAVEVRDAAKNHGQQINYAIAGRGTLRAAHDATRSPQS